MSGAVGFDVCRKLDTQTLLLLQGRHTVQNRVRWRIYKHINIYLYSYIYFFVSFLAIVVQCVTRGSSRREGPYVYLSVYRGLCACVFLASPCGSGECVSCVCGAFVAQGK